MSFQKQWIALQIKFYVLLVVVRDFIYYVISLITREK